MAIDLGNLAWLDEELPALDEIHQRLSRIIPGAQDPQGWARRELAAKTVYVMLYGYAIEGLDRWLRPTAVTDMTDEQAQRQGRAERTSWLRVVQGRKRPQNVEGRWYSENTRESIRDETLRSFVELNVVIERAGLATTSPKPRYSLQRSFTNLLEPRLSEKELSTRIEAWQEKHLSPAALARLVLLRRGQGALGERVLVRLPSGESRRLAPGPSSDLTRAAIEVLAPRFLHQPAVIMISESAQKLSFEDKELARRLGLEIDVSQALPDVILADLGSNPPLLVFIECVVTDGPVSERRRSELEALAIQGGFRPRDCVHVTVFQDRIDSPYRRMSGSLAWGSFVWFATEPNHLVVLIEGGEEDSCMKLDHFLKIN